MPLGSPVLHLRLLLLTLSASDKVKKVLGPRASLDWACFLMLLLHILWLFLSESSVLAENPLFTLGLAVSLSVSALPIEWASSLSRRLEGPNDSCWTRSAASLPHQWREWSRKNYEDRLSLFFKRRLANADKVFKPRSPVDLLRQRKTLTRSLLQRQGLLSKRRTYYHSPAFSHFINLRQRHTEIKKRLGDFDSLFSDSSSDPAWTTRTVPATAKS